MLDTKLSNLQTIKTKIGSQRSSRVNFERVHLRPHRLQATRPHWYRRDEKSPPSSPSLGFFLANVSPLPLLASFAYVKRCATLSVYFFFFFGATSLELRVRALARESQPTNLKVTHDSRRRFPLLPFTGEIAFAVSPPTVVQCRAPRLLLTPFLRHS